MKIAVVNLNRVLDDSKRGKEFAAKLRGIADKWQAQLAEVETKYKNTRERLNKAGPSAPPDTLFRLQRDLSIFEMELQSLQQRQKADIEGHREHFRSQVIDELGSVMADLAKEQGLDLILTRTGNEPAYIGPDADITDPVIERLGR